MDPRTGRARPPTAPSTCPRFTALLCAALALCTCSKSRPNRDGPDSVAAALQELERLSVAAKIALHKAGANGGTGGSPTPDGSRGLSTM